MNFYEKSSGFKEIRKLKTSGDKNTNHSGTPLHYPVLMAHNKTAMNDLIIANTNQRVQILNLQNRELTELKDEEKHTKSVTAIHCPTRFAGSDENLMHVFMTAAEDGAVKIWDRRTNTTVASVNSVAGGFGKRPIYSITTNDNMICAGTKEDILWWDINKLDKPIGNFTECHSDNVTGLSFNSTGKYLISCSVDNVMSMFDLNQHDGAKRLDEEKIIEGAYSSSQPMLDCGFITDEIIWAQTSINTVEFIRQTDAICFMQVDKVSSH